MITVSFEILSTEYSRLSRLSKESKSPIYVTVNNKPNTVLIDINTLEELIAKANLVDKK